MKITKIIIVDDEGNEQVLNIADAVVVAVTDDQRVLTQSSDNEALNMKALKTALKTKE